MNEEPGTDLSQGPWTCWQDCGFEADMDDYTRHNKHLAWHANQDNKITTLINDVSQEIQQRQWLETRVHSLEIQLASVQSVIGTQDNFRFVEKTPMPMRKTDDDYHYDKT